MHLTRKPVQLWSFYSIIGCSRCPTHGYALFERLHGARGVRRAPASRLALASRPQQLRRRLGRRPSWRRGAICAGHFGVVVGHTHFPFLGPVIEPVLGRRRAGRCLEQGGRQLAREPTWPVCGLQGWSCSKSGVPTRRRTRGAPAAAGPPWQLLRRSPIRRGRAGSPCRPPSPSPPRQPPHRPPRPG